MRIAMKLRLPHFVSESEIRDAVRVVAGDGYYEEFIRKGGMKTSVKYELGQKSSRTHENLVVGWSSLAHFPEPIRMGGEYRVLKIQWCRWQSPSQEFSVDFDVEGDDKYIEELVIKTLRDFRDRLQEQMTP